MCWYRTQVRVEPCNHKDATYAISGTGPNDTHTQQCGYCTTEFQAEKHQVVGGICVICGANITDDPTGIKTMEDVRGKMSGVWYDLQGRKLNGKPTTKGVYINNGKAVVVND